MRRKRPVPRARRRPASALPALALIALAGAAACHPHAAASRDASGDGLETDATDPLTLDIGVTGCSHYTGDGTCDPDGGRGPCCTGAPPLTLSFAPIGSLDLEQFLWDFGDGTPPSTERAPAHTFPHPGLYPVTLVAGSSATGMVTPPHPLVVVVETLATGALCDVDPQCGDGLRCVCAPGSGCPSAFVRGVCSQACDAAACAAAAVCAAVTAISAPDAGNVAGAPLCLAACQDSRDCPAGLGCLTLPAGSPAAAPGWTRGCLPLGAQQDLGGPCRDANEALDDRACSTGLCADVGALGICSASCDDSRPCPEQAACVRLPDGTQRCLLICADASSCAQDPLLACAPVLRGDAGASDVMVCAPKSCSRTNDCPAGQCQNGVCVRAAP